MVMNTPNRNALRALSTLTALLVAVAGTVALLATSSDAQARERKATVTGANGKTATRQVVRQRGDVSSSTTGPTGKTSSRSVDRHAGGAQATLTGPNGQTATRSTTRGDGSSSSTVTGPRGQTVNGTVTRQP